MNGVICMKKELVWHIDRAVFEFDSAESLAKWVDEGKKVLFEFEPAGADDQGTTMFRDPQAAAQSFLLNKANSTVRVKVEGRTAMVTAWVKVSADLCRGVDEEAFDAWVHNDGGWASATISLTASDAHLMEDAGCEFRF